LHGKSQVLGNSSASGNLDNPQLLARAVVSSEGLVGEYPLPSSLIWIGSLGSHCGDFCTGLLASVRGSFLGGRESENPRCRRPSSHNLILEVTPHHFFFRSALATLGYVHFYIDFRMNVSISIHTHAHIEILIGIELNLQFILGENWHLCCVECSNP